MSSENLIELIELEMIELEVCMTTQSRVNRRGLSMHPCGTHVLRISEVEVLFPTFTTWGWPIRKSRTQLHRAGFRPRAPSLMKNLEGTTALKDEL